MSTNTIKTRIKHKIGTATEWQTAATNSQFKPLKGELIIYEDATTPRMKIGDGSTLVTELPFVDGIKISVTGSGNAITAASYDENTRTLTLTKGASYTNNTGDITGVTAGKGLTGGATSGTATLNVGAGAGITVTDDAVGHTNSVTADTASEGGSARTLAYGGSFNIPSVTYDAQGHITGKGSIALKLPAKPTFTDTNTTYDLAAAKSKANGSVTLDLTAGGSGSGTDSVTIKGTGATTVTTDANGVITINSTDTNTQTVTSVNSKTGDVSLTYSDVSAAPTSHASTGTTYGVASASNYGHAMASSTSPKANGTAAVGSETAKFARGDHVHPLQTTVSGNAGTATKLQTPVDITLTGDVSGTVSFDGSADVSITTTVADGSHNHSASNITSGTLDAARIPNISIDKLVAGTTNATIPSSLLPAYVDDVLEYTAKANFPTTGETGKIYVDKTTNLTYRWSGSAYVEISPSLALGSTSSTAFAGDLGQIAYDHAKDNSGVEKSSSGLYKITTDSKGHVTGATAVAKADITALGIPGSDTTYSAATSSTLGLVKSGGDVTISSAGVITVNDDSHNHTIANIDNLQTTLDGMAQKTEGAFFVEGTGTTDSTAKTSTWTGTSDRITSYYDGLAIRYKIGVAGQSTVTLNINGLGAKTVYRFGSTKLTTQFSVGSIVNLIYHTDLNDGCWMCNDYDANTNTYQRLYPSTNNVEYPITTRYATTTGSDYYAEYGRYSTGVTLNPSTKTITATAFKGNLTGNADTATKATQDGSGNVITTTYATKTAATQSTAGLMSADDKKKLDGIDAGATANTGTITGVTGGNGLTGSATSGAVTLAVGAGTGITVSADAVAAKLRSTTALTVDSAAATTTSGRVYPVAVDKTGYLAVNVPWTDTNTHAVTSVNGDTGAVTVYAIHGSNSNWTQRLIPNNDARTASLAVKDANDKNVWILNNTTTAGELVYQWYNTSGTYVDQGAIIHTKNYSTSIPAATTSAAGLMSSTDKTKLNGLSNYTLPVAKYNALGGIKPAYSSTGAATLTTAAATNTTTPTIEAKTTTSGRYYGVEVDKNGVLFVNVPWTDNDTVYTHPAGSGASKTSGLYKFSTDSTSHISGVTAVTKADITGLGIPGSDTNYYHTPSYTSTVSSTATGIASSGATNVKIATGTGVNDLYIPVATATTPGITLVYPAASCTTYTSDAGTCTPKAVKQAVEMFAKDYCLPLTGGNISGHVYFTGSKPSSSTGNTSQIVFGTSADQHVAITSNDNALVINPSTTETSNSTTGASQIVLYLNKSSSFPKGITGNLTGTASRATADGSGNNIANTYCRKPLTRTITIPTLSVSADEDGNTAIQECVITVSDLLETDMVFADIDLSQAEYSDWEAIETAWGNVGRIEASDGEVWIVPKASTDIEIPVILKIFR